MDHVPAGGPTCVQSRFSGCVWCPYPPKAQPQSWLQPCPHAVRHVQGWSLLRRGQGSPQVTVSHLGCHRILTTPVPTTHQSLVQSEGTQAPSLSDTPRARRDVAWPVPGSSGTGELQGHGCRLVLASRDLQGRGLHEVFLHNYKCDDSFPAPLSKPLPTGYGPSGGIQFLDQVKGLCWAWQRC